MVKRAGYEPATDFSMSGFKLAKFYADSILRQADSQIRHNSFPEKKKAGGGLPQPPP